MKSRTLRNYKVVASFILCMGVFTILMPSAVDAAMYQIQSLYQHIEGYADVNAQEWDYVSYDENGDWIFNYYYQSDSFTHSSAGDYLSDSVEAWPSYASATVSSWFTGEAYFDAWLEAYSVDGHAAGNFSQYDGQASALSELNLIFTPTVLSQWYFWIDVYNNGSISLVDMNTGNPLFDSFDSAGGYEEYVLTLSPSHNYELNLNATGGGLSYVSLNGEIAGVPEAETIYLLLISIFSVMVMRRYMYNAECQVSR